MKTDDVVLNQVAERDKLETFNIFDAIIYGMKVSVEQHKLKETGTENDGH